MLEGTLTTTSPPGRSTHRDHRVEGRRGEGQRLGVPDDVMSSITPGSLLGLRARPRHGRLEQVQAPHLPSPLDERFGHETRAASDVQSPAGTPAEHGAHPALLSQEPPVVGAFVEVVGQHHAEELRDAVFVGGHWRSLDGHHQIPSKSDMVRYQAR